MDLSHIDDTSANDNATNGKQYDIKRTRTVDSSKNGTADNEADYREKMSQLREKVLLWKSFWYVGVPSLVAAAFGSAFPFFQAFLPVHESDTCLCVYFSNQEEHGSRYLILKNLPDNVVFGLLNGLSSVSFYVINWIFLFIVIRAVYRIRHMKDRLDIRIEMTYVVILWFAFDTLQYFFFELNQLALCPESY